MNKISCGWMLISIVCFMFGACESNNETDDKKDNSSNTNSLTAESIEGEWYCEYREGGIWWGFYPDGTFARDDEYDIEYGKYSVYCGEGGAWGTFSVKNNQLITEHSALDGDNCGTQTYSISLRNNKLFIDGMEYYRFYDND